MPRVETVLSMLCPRGTTGVIAAVLIVVRLFGHTVVEVVVFNILVRIRHIGI